MPQEQLTVRSTEARELAHRLAREQDRSVSDVVLEALRQLEQAAMRSRLDAADLFWSELDAIAARGAVPSARPDGRPLSDLSDLYDDDGLPH